VGRQAADVTATCCYRASAIFLTRSSTGRPVFLLAVTAAWAAALRTVKLRPAFGRWGWLSLSVVAIDHAPQVV